MCLRAIICIYIEIFNACNCLCLFDVIVVIALIVWLIILFVISVCLVDMLMYLIVGLVCLFISYVWSVTIVSPSPNRE